MHTYTVVLEYDPDAPGYSVRVPALRGYYSQGATVEQALAHAKEAIAGQRGALEQIGAPIPEEADHLPEDAGAVDRVPVGRVAA